jgi:hypothetical protein
MTAQKFTNCQICGKPIDQELEMDVITGLCYPCRLSAVIGDIRSLNLVQTKNNETGNEETIDIYQSIFSNLGAIINELSNIKPFTPSSILTSGEDTMLKIKDTQERMNVLTTSIFHITNSLMHIIERARIEHNILSGIVFDIIPLIQSTSIDKNIYNLHYSKMYQSILKRMNDMKESDATISETPIDDNNENKVIEFSSKPTGDEE